MLNIVTWNINGMMSKKFEIEQFLEEHQPHCMVLQETKLCPTRRISFYKYFTYSLDHATPTYGLAILVRNRMQIAQFLNFY